MKIFLERFYQKFLLVAAGGGLVSVALAGGSEGHRISIENLKEPTVIVEPVVIKAHGQLSPIVVPPANRPLIM